jgi:hypothetical protein
MSQYPLGSLAPSFSPTSLLSLVTRPNDRLGSHRACESSQSRPKGSYRVLEGNNTVETSHLGGTGGFRRRKSRRFPMSSLSAWKPQIHSPQRSSNVQLDA